MAQRDGAGDVGDVVAVEDLVGAEVLVGDHTRAGAAGAVGIGIDKSGRDLFTRRDQDPRLPDGERHVVVAEHVAGAGGTDGDHREVVVRIHPDQERRHRIGHAGGMETKSLHADGHQVGGRVGENVGFVDDEVRIRAVDGVAGCDLQAIAELELADQIADGEVVVAELVGDGAVTGHRGKSNGNGTGVAIGGAAGVPDLGGAGLVGHDRRLGAAAAVGVGIEKPDGDGLTRQHQDGRVAVGKGQVIIAENVVGARRTDGEHGEGVVAVHLHHKRRDRIAGRPGFEAEAIDGHRQRGSGGVGEKMVLVDDEIRAPGVERARRRRVGSDRAAAVKTLCLGARIGVHAENPVGHAGDGDVVDDPFRERRHRTALIDRVHPLDHDGVLDAARLDHRGSSCAEAVDDRAADNGLVGQRCRQPGIEVSAGTAAGLVAVGAVAVEVRAHPSFVGDRRIVVGGGGQDIGKLRHGQRLREKSGDAERLDLVRRFTAGVVEVAIELPRADAQQRPGDRRVAHVALAARRVEVVEGGAIDGQRFFRALL